MLVRMTVIAGIVGLCSFLSFGATYSVEVLPTPQNSPSLMVTGMNDSGWVTGFYQDGNYFKSVVWNNEQWDTIPGFSAKNIFTYGINNAGTVTGQSDMPTFFFKGFSFQNGILTNETPDNRIGAVYGINDAGVLCGFAYFNGVGIRAFTKDATGFQMLGTLGGTSSFGTAISSNNIVVGRSAIVTGATEAFICDTGMVSIAPPGANWSGADAVNDFGFAVGSYRTEQGNRGFYYNGYESFDVGMPAGAQDLWMRDINNDGTAVGYAYIEENQGVAVKFEFGSLIDLSTLIDQSNPIQLAAAMAINNRGWIAVLASFDGINGVTAILKPLPPEEITR